MGPFVIVQALWLFLPAYVANMTPVFAAKLFPKWNAPIDGGSIWKDGRRTLGEGKTWRGLWSGALMGALTAGVQAFIAQELGSAFPVSDFGLFISYWAPFIIGFGLGLGAGVGDAVKSFFKRRTGRTSGRPWVPFDQLDFVVGGLAIGYLASVAMWWLTYGDYAWFEDEFLHPSAMVQAGIQLPALLLVILLLTPLLHYAVNLIGYRLKLKRVPW